MAVHIVLVLLFLLGLVWLVRGNSAGLVLSLILGLAGAAAFCIHTWFMQRGFPQFRTAVSRTILLATLVFSLAQIVITILKMAGG